jgi:hypothetical protein
VSLRGQGRESQLSNLKDASSNWPPSRHRAPPRVAVGAERLPSALQTLRSDGECDGSLACAATGLRRASLAISWRDRTSGGSWG